MSQRTADRAAEVAASSASRARKRVRTYVRANRLRYLWTLTYEHARARRREVVADLRRFFERIRARVGQLALVAVIERGGKNDRLHVHFACATFLRHKLLHVIWGLGHVWVGDGKKCAGRVGSRKLAGYLAKYVAKDVEEDAQDDPKGRSQGEHRYLVSQGWAPTVLRARYGRIGAAYAVLLGSYGQPDVEFAFGDWANDPVFGVWYGFPDHCLHPPPRGPQKKGA